MNRGLARGDIFSGGAADRLLFRRTLADAARLWKIRIHAFSLMDNHYHLLVETPLANLSRAMRHIDGVYTQRSNRMQGRDGPLLRGRFKSILVHRETYFLELVRYIHLNGTRAGRFPSAGADTDASHWDYLHPLEAAPWLERRLVLSYFAGDLGALDAFVNQGVPSAIDKTLSRRRWPAILGTGAFVKRIRAAFLTSAQRNKDKPQVGAVDRLVALDPHAVIEETIALYEACFGRNGTPPDALNAEGRWAILAALRRYAQLTYQETAEVFGGISYDAVEKFLKRHDFSDGVFFRRVAERMERRMSNVET